MGGRASLAQINPENLLGQRRDERMAAVHLPAFPAPTEGWEHVECHPDIFKRNLTCKRVATRHMSEEDNHGSDVQRNGRDKERYVGETEQLIMYDDDVV